MKRNRHKALVTGGAGFIGSNLVQSLLKEGFKVKVLDIRPGLLEGVRDSNLEFVGIGSDSLRGGMADRGIATHAVQDVDIVYHLAINWNGHSWRHTLPVADLFDVNIRGTLNLLEAAVNQGVKHFLFSSSIAVYGEPNFSVVDEEVACRPETWEGDPGRAYGILKWTTERLCLLYFHEQELPVTAFRIDVVFSDNEELLVSREIVDRVRKGEDIEVVEGEGSTAIHIDDLTRALSLAVLNKNAYGHVFNLTNPEAYISDRELYRFLVEIIGSPSKINLVKAPSGMNSMLSIDKARSMLGWEPRNGKDERKDAIAKNVRSMLGLRNPEP